MMLLDQSRQGLKNESQSVGKFACGYIQNTGGDIGEMTGYKIYKAVAGVIKPRVNSENTNSLLAH